MVTSRIGVTLELDEILASCVGFRACGSKLFIKLEIIRSRAISIAETWSS